MNTGETLKNYGINFQESSRLRRITPEQRGSELKKNMLAYTNEVLENKAVSLPYQYYFDKRGEVFTDSAREPIFNLELQIDDNERNGWTKRGIYKALNLARENPFRMTALYSPSGPGELLGNPNNHYSLIDYDYGQLYLIFYDNDKINEVALTVSGEGEKFVEELFQGKGINQSTETEKIIGYLDNPIVTLEWQQFFRRKWRENYLMHKNKDGLYYLDEVLNTAEDALKGKKRERKKMAVDDIVDRTLNSELTAESLFRAYMSVIHRYMQANDLSSTSLQGSCGGATIGISQVEMILGFSANLGEKPISSLISGFSSVMRSFYQADNEWTMGKCVSCNSYCLVGGCGFCKTCEKNPSQYKEKTQLRGENFQNQENKPMTVFSLN